MTSNNGDETMVARDGNVVFCGGRNHETKTSVPLTCCFLALSLRLAFTKQRLYWAKSSYQRLLEEGGGAGMDALFHGLEHSLQVLRNEIERIEKGLEDIRLLALPCIRDRMGSYKGFMVFLSGFRQPLDETLSEKKSVDERNKCCIPLLAQDPETTRGIKLQVAHFLGVPMGHFLHDIRNLENLLQQPGNPL